MPVVNDPEVYRKQQYRMQETIGSTLFPCFRGNQPGYSCWCSETRFYVLDQHGDDYELREISDVERDELTLMD